MPKTVGFVGFSESGKTTLATRVAAELTRRGFRVAALKDAHHGFDMDKPGKDSWRYREAGASQVIVRSDRRWAMLVETPEQPSVEELLARFSDVDVILVEGFKTRAHSLKLKSDAGRARPIRDSRSCMTTWWPSPPTSRSRTKGCRGSTSTTLQPLQILL